ncbi:Endo-1,3(4)-beta-glucanase 1, partial [Phytophthora palmivora]
SVDLHGVACNYTPVTGEAGSEGPRTCYSYLYLHRAQQHDSAPGKFVIHLNNSQTWVLYASDKSLSLRVEESVVFSVNASGSSLVADKGYSGTIRVALLPEDTVDDTVYDELASCMVLGGSVSMESRTGYSLHWDVEGITTSPTWSFVEPEADFEVDFYPARKPSPWIALETGMLKTLQKDIIANWSINAKRMSFQPCSTNVDVRANSLIGNTGIIWIP